jgi:hypothetical protein
VAAQGLTQQLRCASRTFAAPQAAIELELPRDQCYAWEVPIASTGLATPGAPPHVFRILATNAVGSSEGAASAPFSLPASAPAARAMDDQVCREAIGMKP